ncbi:unnamed protein product [Euphydryas editha]|uniref:Endonuclease/exonuclease/phosphatase domain-containing protein n=1 Tax=Euphydryas editha TaxID=104508 RepID=A0AAU9UFF5_EUPED|nr:unnamed protein product [Euphydryas editha]
MNIYYQNVRGLRTKTNDVYLNITGTNYEIIVFTETWLSVGIYSNEFIDDSRYMVYRRDRCSSSSCKSDGGGVMIAVSRDLLSTRVKTWESDCEDLWVIINMNINNIFKKVAICAVYLPPPVRLESLSKFLDNTCDVMGLVDEVVLLGDFNLGFINWVSQDNCNHMFPTCYNNLLGHALVDFVYSNNLFQYNNIFNCDNKMLDLIFSTIKNLNVTQPLDLISKLDPRHPNLLLNLPLINTKMYLQPKCRVDYNFFKADYVNINSELYLVDWTHEMSQFDDVDDMVGFLNDTLLKVIDVCVPKRKSNKSRNPPWFTKSLIKLKSEQDKLRRKYHKYKNPRDKLEYDILRNRYHKLNNKCYNEYRDRLENGIHNNPKVFWRFVKDRRKGSSIIPTQMSYNEDIAKTGLEIANKFADYFSSIYKPKTNLTTLPTTSVGVGSLGSIHITKENVLEKLNLLDIHKGAGPDGFPPTPACPRELT